MKVVVCFAADILHTKQNKTETNHFKITDSMKSEGN